MRRTLLAVALIFSTILPGVAQNISVLTQHGDNRRTGWNSRETHLTTANVSQLTFGKSYAMPVDDQIYAQPLVVSNVNIGGTVHNVVYVATVNNTVYAFDGNKSGTFWSKNYTRAGARVPNHTDMTGACGGNYNDFSGNIGIVGTPVIDSVRQTMYFVARSTDTPTGSKGTGNFFQYLHAIDITTGNERANSPVLIAATENGSGDGNVNGVLSFNAQHENQRSGLLLLNGVVYITYASHCDWPPYHGWILGYDETSLQQKTVFNTTPDGAEGGIWMSAAGLSADENGNMYVSVGNGSITTNTGGRDYGESALKLTPSGNTLAVSSYFTAKNFPNLNDADLDFGSTQMVLIPFSTVAVTGCKDGSIYVMNRDNLGGYSSSANNVLQTISLGSGKTLRAAFSYFKGSAKEWLYIWSENSTLKAYPFLRSSNTFDVANEVDGTAQGPTGNNGALLSVSSNGSKDGTGILWATHASAGDANPSTRPGILRAFDANNVTKELWNSNMKPGDNIGNYAKFVCPTIANGRVYLATFSNQLAVYGVTDTVTVPACNGVADLAKGKPATASSVESALLSASNVADSNLTTRWASSQGADPQSVYVDLGSRFDLCKVVLNWEVALASNFQIQVSDDALTWTTVSTVTGNTAYQNILYVKGSGRYVRMLGTARGTNYGYSLYEFQVFGTPGVSCAPTSGLTASAISRTGATLNWNALPGVNSYLVSYKSVAAPGFTTATVNNNSLVLNSLSCGTDYLFNVQAACSSSATTVLSSNQAFSSLICDGSCGFLPTRWSNSDIGIVGLAGAACFNNGIFRLKASGTDIWNNADGLQFAYKTFTGDGAVAVRVDSISAANPWAKAGVMFRETLDSGSRQVLMAVTPGPANGAAFQYRRVTGGQSINTNLPGISLPYFIKVVKRGTVYSGFISPDSLTWQPVGVPVDLGFGTQPLEAGIALSSHDNSQLAKAVFSHVPVIFTADTSTNTNCPAVNIALNRPAASSSRPGTDKSYYEFNAFDANLTTAWVSQPGIDPQWLYVDLGKQFHVCQVTINWGAQYASAYQVQVSTDAVSWTTLQAVTGNKSLTNSLALNGTCRFLRIYGTSRATTMGYSIAEVQVSGIPVASQPLNIALHAPAVSSTNESSLVPPAAVVDGQGFTRWASQQQTDPSWIYLDLGASYNLTQVVIDWEVALAQDYQLQVSSDAVNWTTVKSVAGNLLYTNIIPLAAKGRYVRMYGTKRGFPAGYSIYEFEVYGSPLNAVQQAFIKPKLTVYPVPAHGSISLATVDNILGEVNITDIARSATFRPVYQSRAAQKVTLDISALQTGLYIFTIQTTRGKVSSIVSLRK